MVAFRRRPVKTHARLAKKELREGMTHFAQAATHAADGMGATVGPRLTEARTRVSPAASKMKTAAVAGMGGTVATLAPLAIAAREGVRKARPGNSGQAKDGRGRKAKAGKGRAAGRQQDTRQRGQFSRIVKLLMAGAAVGGAAAMVLRRRRRQQEWEEYDPGRPLEAAAGATTEPTRTGDSAAVAASTTPEAMAGGVSPVDAGTATPTPGIARPVPNTEAPSVNRRN